MPVKLCEVCEIRIASFAFLKQRRQVTRVWGTLCSLQWAGQLANSLTDLQDAFSQVPFSAGEKVGLKPPLGPFTHCTSTMPT